MGKIIKVVAVLAAIILAGFGIYCLTRKSSADDEIAE